MSGYKTKIDALFNAEKDGYDALKNTQVRNAADSAYNNLKADADVQLRLGGDKYTIGNCTVFRRGVVGLENVICFNMFKQFHAQTGLTFAAACAMLVTALALFVACVWTVKLEKVHPLGYRQTAEVELSRNGAYQ